MLKYRFMLITAAFFWGTAFVAQRVSTGAIGPFAFNGIRFLIGAIAILPLVWRAFSKGQNTAPAGSCRIPVIGAATILGFILFSGAALQQVGLFYTTAGKAGFITALYIVFVPLFGLLLGNALRISHVIGCVLAFAGLYLLAFHGAGEAINQGDALVLLGVIFWTLHILAVGYFVRYYSGLTLAFGQFIGCSIFNLLAMPFAGETLTFSMISGAMVPILYCGLFSSGVGFTLQIIGQEKVPPTEASLLCSFEMIFSAIAGYILINELMSFNEVMGAVLMTVGIFSAQIPSRAIFNKKSLP